MSSRTPDSEAVVSLLTDAASTLIMPRHGRLEQGDVHEKPSEGDPLDIVTVVDREVELALTPALEALVPGSLVIGEEGVHADPSRLSRLQSDGPVWLLDPIDGTKNFAAGRDGFGVMLAFVRDGHARAAWILLPARGECYVAEAGGGVRLNGRPVAAASGRMGAALRGTLHQRYMPASLARTVTTSTDGRFEQADDLRCAAVEYTDVLRGAREFGVFYRLHPWDHAAPALVLSEGGGEVSHLDGRPYSARSSDQITIVATTPAVAATVRGWLTEPAGPEPS